MTDQTRRPSTQALKVRQWIAAWDKIHWNPGENRRQPPHWFYQFNLPAIELRRLSGVYARTTNRTTAADDFGIQRQLDKERSNEIGRFVEFGFSVVRLEPCEAVFARLPRPQAAWLVAYFRSGKYTYVRRSTTWCRSRSFRSR